MTIEVKKNDRLLISKSARPYVSSGFRSSKNILPAEEFTVVVTKITKTKRGRKVRFTFDNKSQGHGAAIMIDDLPDFMTVTHIN